MNTCTTCQSICNPCGGCTNTTCFNCSTTPCVACEETFGMGCVYLENDIQCTAKGNKITKGINLEQVITQLLCKIDRLEYEILYIKATCCPSTTCEIPVITSATPS